MINLYDSKETDFTHNGIVVLNDCISCTITEELNGLFECEILYPLLDSVSRVGVITPPRIVGRHKVGEQGISQIPPKWTYLLEGNIIKVDGQLYRIYHKQKTLSSIKVNARHIFYDLLDNFLEDVRPTFLSGYGALDYILTHTQYAHPFTSSGDVGGSNTKYFVRTNPVNAIMGQDGIIATWGGELVRDNFTISLLNARGLDRGVLVAYGKNIQGIEETLDMDGLCTRLMPIGKDGLLLTEKYIDSPYINNFPHPKIKVVELNDCEDEATLRTAATKYMLDNKIDIPQFNYKIDFLELSKTEEYKNYAVLERVYMGDTVTIKHSKLNINLKAKVIKITKNILTNRIEKIELGSFKPNLATTFNNAIQGIKQDIVQVTSDYQKAIDNATSLITGSNGGNVVIRQGEDGKPYEILIMDTTDVMAAVNVWRWNLGGFGYSSTGVNGPYGTAITMDGHIVASFITALEISANQIIGGTLTLGGATYGNGVITLRNDANTIIGTIDKNGVFLAGGTFSVDPAGFLTATRGRIGTMTLGNAGQTGWSCIYNGTPLEKTGSSNSTGMGGDADWAFWAGDGRFRVNNIGEVTIGIGADSSTLSSDGLRIGTGFYVHHDGGMGVGQIMASGSIFTTGDVVADGNIWSDNNISALSFTDRTPLYVGDALAEIALISDDGNGGIDHSTLPKFAQKRIKMQKIKLDKDGKKIILGGKTIPKQEEIEEDGRDLGAMISILTVGIQQLTELVKNQEIKLI